ncbi:propionyl-CoA synthetase [Niveispirillum fermenti]|uniref:propionyl-CoA synthetase n=1 Tax=Niveispirillum fermenti TaxID=1233113 RepID=UPI004042B7DE
MTGRYQSIYNQSMADPVEFWRDAAEAIEWDRFPTTILDESDKPFYRWYRGGRLNICHNALDRHVAAGRGAQVALIHDSPVSDSKRFITYAELLDQVARLAGALRDQGVTQGDRVIIYMPMIPEAVAAMLACARIGAVHSVVFGGFAPHELATRINDATPKVIMSASCGIEGSKILPYKPMLDAAIDQAHHKPAHCIIFQRPQAHAALTPGRDLDWGQAMEAARPADCVMVEATDPLYILYTSGTTGQPKGVVRDTGGYAVALKWTMEHFYGLKPGEVFWTASDVGWVVGHSYIVYGPLLQGCTTLVYEGKPVGTPDAAAFWRVIEEHKVVTLFTAPTAFRAIKREDPNAELIANHDISTLRALFLAGERSDPDTLNWAETHLKVPVIDHWWQTETGWPIAGNPLGLDLLKVKYGSTAVPLPGWDIRVLAADGTPVKRGDIGAIVARLPLPPGTLPTLWNAREQFFKSYLADFPGYYQTSDAGFIDDDGYIFVMARTDDIINVAGHRLSTGAMEEVLSGHSDVAECAVIGVADALKGQLPLGFIVLKRGVDRPHAEILAEIVKKVRDEIGPVAAFKQALVVERLPKTRSGKILRGTMQKIADSEAWKMPATIDDPATLDEIGTALKQAGYAKAG